MNDLSTLSGKIYDIADELAASNDRAEAVQKARDDELVARLAANRKGMNRPDDIGQPRSCDTGAIIGNFVSNYSARR